MHLPIIIYTCHIIYVGMNGVHCELISDQQTFLNANIPQQEVQIGTYFV